MKASDLKSKIAKTFQGFSIDKMLGFVKRNVRYISAGVLFVALVFILAKCTDGTQNGSVDGTEMLSDTEIAHYEVDAIPTINDLISNYYSAYADGDIDKIEQYANPVSDREKSYIQMFSAYVDDYENIKCYLKPGVTQDSYLVSAYMEIRFVGVDTLAPGLDFFYVEKNEQGEYYINNLYSQYNLLYKEQEIDEAVHNKINNFELEEDVVVLQREVQQKFDDALASDAALEELISITIKDACMEWAQNTAQESTENVPLEDTETQNNEPVVTDVPVAEIVYATSKVNIRAAADETSDIIDTVDEGTALTRTGTTDTGWSRLEYDTKECYVKTEFLTTESPSQTTSDSGQTDEGGQSDASEGTADASGLAEGTTVVLKNTVNIRESMSTDSSKVGTAFEGESVTVILSYAEGWTKVKWKDKTGFIKTDVLK